MSHGRLRASGTSIALKKSFGVGYQLDIALNSDEGMKKEIYRQKGHVLYSIFKLI